MIWGIATMAALAWFSLRYPLIPLNSAPELSVGDLARVRLVNLAIQLPMLVWMYIIYRGLSGYA